MLWHGIGDYCEAVSLEERDFLFNFNDNLYNMNDNRYRQQTATLDRMYWNQRWTNQQTGWDIGFTSPALMDYFQKMTDKSARILIPGCGNAYEAEALLQLGFENITLVDIAEELVEQLHEKFKDQKGIRVLCMDFFELEETFDYIVEQTFFCALDPTQREAYAKKMTDLLSDEGELFGLLFNRIFTQEGPPYGGEYGEYMSLFSSYFKNVEMEICDKSIGPRAGTELFFNCKNKI